MQPVIRVDCIMVLKKQYVAIL
ncbi:hypothetical protein PSEUDO8AS_40017 [Pseudomonas sp. 8AS]|nr:hypothetical protein PSEUDO8AS_40017 [Pseudomonas sp. 8AS]